MSHPPLDDRIEALKKLIKILINYIRRKIPLEANDRGEKIFGLSPLFLQHTNQSNQIGRRIRRDYRAEGLHHARR